MKRSEINAAVARAEADFARAGLHLPPFAAWTPADWRRHGSEATATMRATGLGWDVTDFAAGDFARRGLLLFTTRNGLKAGGPGNRPYAEKAMIARRDQMTPMHRHLAKVEDIINRASLHPDATLALRLFAMDRDGGLDRTARLAVQLDGLMREVEPGSVVRLAPGESITLFPGTWHAFWGENGDVVVGEVSSVNDDYADNVFAEPLGRFPAIIEDAEPTRLIVPDYAALER
ncbi:D-lyxose/D-mannose family sugar isomerase [Lichenihabitans sp. Uapishka_5]|uniref:D-lyxose/D-mannose family sugar isomerase n=1 Tax=Lichenihabitans sp. Uapishka_5 TaxID=3037302 RepID=UPI0029E7D067|nr:D-lyxose/D-mannose family sugar isomerase [Lichenihabitans sp. Uapishka_5]MDX7952220.1 D-lyxose/D-mannose family sugar isomerase [Lichenihabitans sp. Uapishka_5]